MSTSKSIAQYRFLVRPNVEHLYRSALVGIAVVAFSSLAMAQNNNGFNGSFNSQPNGQQNGTVGNGAATNGNFSTQTNQVVGNQGVGNQGVSNQGVSNQGVSNQGVSNQGGSQVQPATNQSTNGLGGQVPLPDVRANPNQPLPRPFPELSQSHVQYLNQLLAYWETNSNKIKRYHCKYTNWTYNSLSVPIKDPSSKHVFAQSIEVGMIKFAAPDKGLMETEKIWAFDKERYTKQQDPFKESPQLRQKWLCTGKATYSWLFSRKELHEVPIPKELQGERIVDGPLPFLFGAKADRLKARYWIRVITPPERGEKGEYWLEAYPKYRRDAGNFQKVEIILEKKDFLPAVLTLYSPDHNPAKGTVAKQTIKFEKRKIWQNEQLNGIQRFFDELTNAPSTPFGWRRVNTQLRDNAASAAKGGNLNR